jgi:hypothetical protein
MELEVPLAFAVGSECALLLMLAWALFAWLV